MSTSTSTSERAAPRFGLKPRVTLLLLFFAIVPAAVVLGILYEASRGLLKEDAQRELAVRAEYIAASLDEQNTSMQAIARVIARSPLVVEGLQTREHDGISGVLERFRGGHGAIVTVVVTDTAGVVVGTTTADGLGRDLSKRTNIQRALRGEASISEVRASSMLPGEPMVVGYATPVRAGNDVVGALSLAINVEHLWERVRQANGNVSDQSYALVTDTHGIRIAHSFRTDHIFHPTGPLPADVVEFAVKDQRFGTRTSELLGAVIAEPLEYERSTATSLPASSLVRYQPKANGEWNLSVAHRLSTVPWTVFVQVPERAVFGSVDSLWQTTVAFGLLVALFGGLLAYLVARTTADQLVNMAEVAEAVIAGDNSKRVRHAERDSSELGNLMRSLNSMVDAVTTSRQVLEARVDERTVELKAANTELGAQRSELLAQAEELRTQQRELARKNDEVERADRLKSEFLANMSHELRTPLNSVIGFTDLVLSDDEDVVNPRHREFLGEVTVSARHLLNLINEILDLSKIEAGHARLDRSSLSTSEVVGDAVELISAQAHKKGLKLTTTVTTLRHVDADPGRLRQILLNLLSNAVKMSPQGGAVSLRAEDDGIFVRFVIDDNGPGVSAELAARLFSPFVQGESPLTKSQQGTGLGLAISRRLVDLHGGSIGVERAPGGGARFHFTIPGVVADVTGHRTRVLLIADRDRSDRLQHYLRAGGYDPHGPAVNETPEEAVERLRPSVVVVDMIGGSFVATDVVDALRRGERATLPIVLFGTTAQGFVPKPIEAARLLSELSRVLLPPARVLSIDDDPKVGELLRELLRPAGYDVHCEVEPQSGVRWAKENKPDAILVDLMMPGMSGFEVIDALAHDPVTHDVPVIVFTAKDITAADREWLRSRARAVAEKGNVTLDELLVVVERAVRLNGPTTPTPTTPLTKSILVVDDNDQNRSLIAAMLKTEVEKAGYTLHSAADGPAALDACAANPPSLILLDINMPGMDGFEVVRRLRATPSLAMIPVVAVTALAMAGDEERARAAGFDGYVTKPVDRKLLLRLVRERLT